MATIAIFALCQAGGLPWWTVWIALGVDTVATLGITISIAAAGRRHGAARLPWSPDKRHSAAGRDRMTGRSGGRRRPEFRRHLGDYVAPVLGMLANAFVAAGIVAAVVGMILFVSEGEPTTFMAVPLTVRDLLLAGTGLAVLGAVLSLIAGAWQPDP
jgi:hypothetical protein